MTPTVTQAGETVTVWIGGTFAHLTPDEAVAHADAVRCAATKAKEATWQRRKDDERAAQAVRFRAMYPDAVPVSKPGMWGAEEGIGAYRSREHGPVAEVLWNTGRWTTDRIDVIPSWPVPVQLRERKGRTAHTWRGGVKGVCGASLQWAELPLPNTKPCPECAAIEAARGGAF